MSITIRPAKDNDNPALKQLLLKLDLYYSTLEMKDFWVAEDQGKIVGAVQLQEHDNFIFLGSLGVLPDQQKHGLAKALLNKVLPGCKKDIYLYTIIPDFFKKFGFSVTSPLPNLPTKANYECEACHSDQCVTMVRHAA